MKEEIGTYDVKDEPKKILQNINKNLFKKPMLINVHTNRIFWHAGAGKDNEKVFDRYLQQKKQLGKKANFIDTNTKKTIEKLWAKN
jgi:hypothetical protein